MSNESLAKRSLREWLGIAGPHYPSAARIITDAIVANLIKPAESANEFKKPARYLPYRA